MKKTTRILSFLLALVLVFGCLSSTAIAMTPIEISGGTVTDKEIASGNMSAALDNIPEAGGILSISELNTLLGSNVIATNDMSATSPQNTNDYETIKTDESGNTYITIHEAKNKQYTCGTNAEFFFQLNHPKTNNNNNAAKNYQDYKGRSFVVSIDIRLEADYDLGDKTLFDIRSYYAFDGDTMTSIAIRPLVLCSDGTLKASGVALEKKVNKSTTNAVADFTTVAIHVLPDSNTYHVYVDGECQTEGMNLAFVTGNNVKKLTFTDKTHTVSGVTYTLSSKGPEDFTLAWVRALQTYKAYHGDQCPDNCTETHTDTSEIFTMTGDQLSLDSFKAYYADFYVECAEHKLTFENHEHNDVDLTSSVKFSCDNCFGKWECTVPFDNTGNSICDLCELNGEQISPLHNAEEINKILTPSVGSVNLHDGTKNFSNPGDSITQASENGNKYYVLGGGTGEFFTGSADITNTANSANTIRNFKTTPYKGKSFVFQADLRLGKNFFAENQTVDLFKIFTYMSNTSIANGSLSSIYSVIARINSTGKIAFRNGSNNTYTELASLNATDFTTVAIHVKTANSTNKFGSYDIYINDELIYSDMQFLTEAEEKQMHFDATLKVGTTSYSIKAEGVKDYCLSFCRFFHVFSSNPITKEDYLHADNLIGYFTETYQKGSTKHEFIKSEHTHDYTKTFVSSAAQCTKCGALKGYTALIDKNNDSICDLCVYTKVNTKGNGVIDPTLLADKIGAENVVISSTVTDSSSYGFSKVANDSGAYRCVTENGNTYLQISKKTDPASESFVDARSNSSADLAVKNFSDYAGRSFIYSLDVKLGESFDQQVTLFQILSYILPKEYAENGEVKTLQALNIAFVRIAEDGKIKYRSAGSDITSSYQLEKGADDFTTISIHVRPREGSYGLYTIYANGVPIVSDVQFLTKSESESITWKSSSLGYSNIDYTDPATKTLSVNGAKDFVLGFIRSFHIIRSATLPEGNFASVDNPKLYYSEKFIECAKHSYTCVSHTHDATNNTMYANLVCSCGAEAEISLPIDSVGNGKCDTCNAAILGDGVAVTKRQVKLGSLIEIKLFATADDPEGKTLVLRVADKTESYALSELEADENGEYTVSIKMSSIDMANDVTATLISSGTEMGTYTTSVRDYAMKLYETTESAYERELVIKMLNYGAMAQNYFAEIHSDSTINQDLANKDMTDSDRQLEIVTSDMLKAYTVKVSGSAMGVNLSHFRLVLDSETSVKLYFGATEPFSASLDGRSVTPAKDNELYYVRISNILPAAMSNEHTLAITVGEDTLTVTFNVLSAIDSLLASDSGESFKQLGRAIYLYNRAALLYTAEATAKAEVVVKDGAKGAVALVLDDGGQEAADYAAGYMQKYDKTVVSFALNTKNLASFVKSGNDYVMSEDGRFTFTQNATQEAYEAYWNNYLNLLDKNGNALGGRIELISHSHTHDLPKDGNYYAELLGARHILQDLFGYNSEALITPGGFSKNDDYDAVKMEIYIAGRGTNQSENAYTMINTLSEFDKAKRARLDSYMVQHNKVWLTDDGLFPSDDINAEEALRLDENGKADVSHVEAFIDAAMENSGLAAFCIHGIVDKTATPKTNLHTYNEQADAIFAYVQKHAETGDLWSATYSDAVKYFCEWNTSELDTRRVSDDLISICLSDKEDDEIFDMELTVKVDVSDDWTEVSVNYGDRIETISVKGEAGARYVLVNILPDSGIVTLTKA